MCFIIVVQDFYIAISSGIFQDRKIIAQPGIIRRSVVSVLCFAGSVEFEDDLLQFDREQAFFFGVAEFFFGRALGLGKPGAFPDSAGQGDKKIQVILTEGEGSQAPGMKKLRRGSRAQLRKVCGIQKISVARNDFTLRRKDTR